MVKTRTNPQEYLTPEAQAEAAQAIHNAQASSKKAMEEARKAHIGRDAAAGKKSIAEHIGGAWETVTKYVLPLGLLGAGAGMLMGNKTVGKSAALKTALNKTHQASELLNSTPGTVIGHAENVFGQENIVTKGIKATSRTIEEHAGTIAAKGGLAAKAVSTLKSNMLLTTVFGIGSTIQGIHSVYSKRYDQARTLQQMQFDLTGEKVSKDQALHSKNLNPLVMQIREKERSSGRAKAAKMLDIAGIAGNLGVTMFMHDGGSSGSMFSRQSLKVIGANLAVSGGTAIASSILTAKDTALKGYHDMYVEQATKGRISAETYRAVIGGFNPKADDRMVSEMANQAAAHQLKPKEVLEAMQEMQQQGSFVSRVAQRGTPQRGVAVA